MKPQRHPSLGLVGPIPVGTRPAKVWKHLYAPEEGWARIVPDPRSGPFAARAEAIALVTRAEHTELPELEPHVWRKVLPVLNDDHDQLYCPVYVADLLASDTEWAPAPDDPNRQCGLSTRAVYLVVDRGEPGRVVTAYRPHPPASRVHLTEDGLRRHARHFFRRKTRMRRDDLARQVAEDLEELPDSVPSTTEALWELASAVGFARAVGDLTGEGARQLAAGERRLASTPRELVTALLGSLRWAGVLDGISEALRRGDREGFDAALLDAEALLVAATALGAETESSQFLRDALEVLAWTPSTMGSLLVAASSRADDFREDALVRELWGGVATSIAAAGVREEAPAVRPGARLVEGLLPVPSAWEPWLRMAEDVRSRLGEVLQGAAKAADDLVRGFVVQPQPVRLGDGDDAPWRLRELVTTAGHVRVFVVDEENPKGHAVELGEDLDLWHFEKPGQRALVVVAASDKPIAGDSLHEVLLEAGKRADVVVRTRVVSRPK